MSTKKTSKNSDAIPDQSAFFIGGPIIIYACHSHTNDLVENWMSWPRYADYTDYGDFSDYADYVDYVEYAEYE